MCQTQDSAVSVMKNVEKVTHLTLYSNSSHNTREVCICYVVASTCL